MTFKDLKKRLSLETAAQQQQSEPLEIYETSPFGFGTLKNIHKKTYEQIEIAALIMLLIYQKNDADKLLYEYDKIIFDSLVTQNGNAGSHSKDLWIKKAICLGISGFMLRFMAWRYLKDNALSGSQMCIVTGPRIDLAIAPIDRLKKLFYGKTGLASFDTKETVIFTDGARWYNDACKWLGLKHMVYENRLKNLMERFVQQIKDRTECFDDHFPCRRQNCNIQHVWNWLKLLVLYLHMSSDRIHYIPSSREVKLTEPSYMLLTININHYYGQSQLMVFYGIQFHKMPLFIYFIEPRVPMSTTKEQRREKQEETTTVTPSTSTTTTAASSQVQREQRQSVNRALDETKDNIRRATDEARRDIPRYTQAVNEYHEQTIQAARDIADNYLESQKEIINSLQSAWVPQIEAANRVFTSNWMVSPRHLADNYARIVSSFADNTIAATKLVNNTMFANLEAFKTSVQNARDNVKEFSRIGVNAAKTLEQTARDTARASGHDTSSARFYVEKEEQQQRRL